MTADFSRFTAEEFSAAFGYVVNELVKPLMLTPVEKPVAILLGGQSGAGKTYLHTIFRERLAKNVIVINGDEYRRMHPHYNELQETYGKDAVSHTAAWAGAMVEHLINALSKSSYNLIIEGTLRTVEVPAKTAVLLRSRGYSVWLAMIAVKPEISLLSCQIRYEQMRLAGTTPRATDPAYHDRIVHDIVENLATLEESGTFDEIYIYDRMERCLYPPHMTQVEQSESISNTGMKISASEVLREKLFGKWSDQELAHLSFLEHQLSTLCER